MAERTSFMWPGTTQTRRLSLNPTTELVFSKIWIAWLSKKFISIRCTGLVKAYRLIMMGMVTLIFFPDYPDSAEEALMMLENKSVGGSLIFEGFTLTGFDQGKWNVMDNGDINQDGAPDLILGSFVVQDPYGRQQNKVSQWIKNSLMLLVLKNLWHE